VRATYKDTRLRGALVLALCSGVSYYFTTGEGTAALVISGVLAVALALLVLGTTPGRRWRSAADFYALAIPVLVMPWLLMKTGYTSRSPRTPRPAWHDLQQRYPATGHPPPVLDPPRDILVSRVRSYRIRTYPYKRVAASFGDSAVYLAHAFPLNLLYSPVELPLGSIWRCRQENLEPGTATLSIRDLELEIRLPDEEKRILGWCAQHELPEDLPPREASAP
jgi:hypothetical protein